MRIAKGCVHQVYNGNNSLKLENGNYAGLYSYNIIIPFGPILIGREMLNSGMLNS